MKGPAATELLEQIKKTSPAAGRLAEDLVATVGRSYELEIHELKERNDELARDANVEKINAARSLLSAGLPCDPEMSLGDMINLALRQHADLKNAYAADLERLAHELHAALGLPKNGEQYEGHKDWGAWWRALIANILDQRERLSSTYKLGLNPSLGEMVKAVVRRKSELDLQDKLIEAYGQTLVDVRSLHQRYFAGTEWEHKEGMEFLPVMEKTYEAASKAMARDFVAEEMKPKPKPKDVTIEQLQSMFKRSQDELMGATDTAILRGKELAKVQTELVRAHQFIDRLKLAVQQEETRRKQEKARADALVLAATEPGLESPSKFDYAWSPGIDVIAHLRREMETRQEGWERFEREAGRLGLENEALKQEVAASKSRLKEMEEFVSRASLSVQSVTVPGPGVSHERPVTWLEYEALQERDGAAQAAVLGEYEPDPIPHSHEYEERCENWCVARGGCGDSACEHAPDGGQHPRSAAL